MILSKIEDAPVYRGIHPRLDRVLELLAAGRLSDLGTETTALEGDALYATRFDLVSSEEPDRPFESHRRYLDVFVCLSGCERIDLARPEELRPFAQRDDYWGYHGEAAQSVVLRPGSFLVLFPSDAHRPGGSVKGAESFSRLVFKILFKES